MLKAALFCSAVCTAFVVGDRTSVASQDKPAKVAKAVSLHEVLRPYVGKKCFVIHRDAGKWYISLEKRDPKVQLFKFDMIGVDFIRLSRNGEKTHLPFSSIQEIVTN